MNLNFPKSARFFTDKARPYGDARGWIVGIWVRWKTVVATAFASLIVSNGCASTLHSLPWPAVAKWGDSVGVSWQSALILAIMQALYFGAQHITQANSNPPFSK